MTTGQLRPAKGIKAFDESSGQVFPTQVVYEPERSSAQGFGPDGFRMAGEYAFRVLITMAETGQISTDAFKVAIWLATCRTKSGLKPVRVTTAMVRAKFPSIAARAATACLTQLSEHGFVSPTAARGLYYVNPSLSWRGPLTGHVRLMQGFRQWWNEDQKPWEEHPSWNDPQ